MSTIEKLQKIKAKCEWLVEFYGKRNARAVAGWKATIAAIDDILPYLQEDDAAADGAATPGHRWLLVRRSAPIISAWEGLYDH